MVLCIRLFLIHNSSLVGVTEAATALADLLWSYVPDLVACMRKNGTCIVESVVGICITED